VQNLGNTCFLNATLQALPYALPLSTYSYMIPRVLSKDDNDSNTNTNPSFWGSHGNNVTEVRKVARDRERKSSKKTQTMLGRLFKFAHGGVNGEGKRNGGSKKPLQPLGFVKHAQKICSGFQGIGSQEDAHEYLVALLSGLVDDLSGCDRKKPPPSLLNVPRQDLNGVQTSKLKCPRCQVSEIERSEQLERTSASEARGSYELPSSLRSPRLAQLGFEL